MSDPEKSKYEKYIVGGVVGVSVCLGIIWFLDQLKESPPEQFVPPQAARMLDET